MTIDEKKTYLNKWVVSAWSGHLDFADWLMRRNNPRVVVELGVDYGFSLCSFALSGIGNVYGIDWFKGDLHTGYRQARSVVEKHINYFEFNNVTLIESTFEEAAKDWVLPIDILHIDGLHEYNAVKADYVMWTKFLNNNGVVLMHDTCVDAFGVKDFFHEIDFPKLNFINSNGLGVVCMDEELLKDIRNNFKDVLDSRY
jgi:hypothetical protein